MPDPLAEMDQAIAASRDVARAVAAYRAALIGAGVPAEDALPLAAGYQEVLLRS